jgi:hypothetical protein
MTIKKIYKVQAMLKGAVKLLANKGYSGTTIIERTEASDKVEDSDTIIILKTKRN